MRAQLVHGEQDATMNRFEAVAHVWKGPTDDHAHRVIEVTASHLVFEIDRDDFLGEFRHAGFRWIYV